MSFILLSIVLLIWVSVKNPEIDESCPESPKRGKIAVKVLLMIGGIFLIIGLLMTFL